VHHVADDRIAIAAEAGQWFQLGDIHATVGQHLVLDVRAHDLADDEE
jgi:hypothetical protein